MISALGKMRQAVESGDYTACLWADTVPSRYSVWLPGLGLNLCSSANNGLQQGTGWVVFDSGIPFEKTLMDNEWKLPPQDELESPILSLVGQPYAFIFLPIELGFVTPVKVSLHILCLLGMKLILF